MGLSSLDSLFWVSTFDELIDWETQVEQGAGWQFLTVAEIVELYGTDGRQAFTRADGRYAHIESHGGTNAVMVSPPIRLAESITSVELLGDIQFRHRGGCKQILSASVRFDDGPASRMFSLSEEEESGQLNVVFEVPREAKTLRLVFLYESDRGGGSCSVDNIQLSRLPSVAGTGEGDPEVRVHVFSDVQGSLEELTKRVLPGFAELGAADALVINGDLVDPGSEQNWAQLQEAMREAGVDRYPLVISTIGNHEYYPCGGGESPEDFRERFLDYTGMRGVGDQGGLWGEIVLGGRSGEGGTGRLAVLWIGTESFDYAAQDGCGPFMTMSEEQFEWLRGRLAHSREVGIPVVLFSHFVFPYSVSGTHTEFTRQDYGQWTEPLGNLLQEYSETILFTSHTHWSVRRGDWAVQKRFDPAAPVGVPVINTGSVTTQYGPYGDWDERGIAGEPPSGLCIELRGRVLRVNAYEFTSDGPELVNFVEFRR